MFKGWKTVAFGLFMVIVPPALNFLDAVHWTELGISPGMSAAIGAAIIALRAVTSTPIGKAVLPFGFIFAAGLALAACTGGAQNTGIKIAGQAAAAASILLSAEDVATMQSTCQAARPALDVATGSGMPAQVSGTAVYPKAFCDQLATGALPPTADASSPQWLNTTLAVLSGAAKLAGVVLPLLL